MAKDGIFVINILDPEGVEPREPLQKAHMDVVLQYVEAFFNRSITVVHTPVEKFNRPLQTRRTSANTIAYNAADLIECMNAQQAEGVGPIGPFPTCIGMLGLTAEMLYNDKKGEVSNRKKVLPDELLTPYSSSRPKIHIGVCTVTNLRPPLYRPTSNLNRLGADEGAVKANLDRILLRRLLMFIPHEVCRLLGFKTCDARRCLCYKQPFDPITWNIFLCPQCESNLAHWICSKETEKEAYERLLNLERALCSAEEVVGAGVLAYGHRRHSEFEQEIDWLRAAAYHFEGMCNERKEFALRSTGNVVRRKRSVSNLITSMHRNAPPQTLTRTLSVPDIKRHCLLDMTTPAIRDSVAIGPWKGQGWPDKVVNAKHSTGGHYVELGGSLNPKSVGGFSLGLNSSTLKGLHTT